MLPQRPAGVSARHTVQGSVDGVVAWDDLVKGRIEIANAELDDLVIARADLTPTYNFWSLLSSTTAANGDSLAAVVNNKPYILRRAKRLCALSDHNALIIRQMCSGEPEHTLRAV